MRINGTAASAGNSAAARRYYRRNRKAILAKQKLDRTVINKKKWRERRVKLYRESRAWLDALKISLGCTDCGYNAHPAALDFDHLDPSKKRFQIASSLGRPREAVLAEIAKCELVCANCHRIRGVKRRALCV